MSLHLLDKTTILNEKKTFFITDGTRCLNVTPVKLWKCNLITYSCRLEGDLCIGSHDKISGHFYGDRAEINCDLSSRLIFLK